MIDKTELKSILICQDLSEEILEKIASEAYLNEYQDRTRLFYQNEDLTDFYMLLSGRVVLKAESPSGNVITMERVSPGESFGFSAFMGESKSSFKAICAAPSRIIAVSGEKMLRLCEEDGDLGYSFMLKVVKLFKSRMEKHTGYFLDSIANHPEIKKL